MNKVTVAIATGTEALVLAATTLASPAGVVGRAHGPQFPGGQGGFHHPGSGVLHGAAGRHRRASDHGRVWRGGFDGGGLY